jgi:hypothetical protein
VHFVGIIIVYVSQNITLSADIRTELQYKKRSWKFQGTVLAAA